ncbi:MAG TPA: hypothetical protein DDW52_09310 [Planctomycetaceae bacterium]|nr:hypothetical protein [Planctomycetaceae bacterium]
MDERRQDSRIQIERHAVLFEDAGSATPVRIVEASRNSVGVELYGRTSLAVGDSVRIKIREAEVTGEITRFECLRPNTMQLGIRLIKGDLFRLLS